MTRTERGQRAKSAQEGGPARTEDDETFGILVLFLMILMIYDTSMSVISPHETVRHILISQAGLVVSLLALSTNIFDLTPI